MTKLDEKRLEHLTCVYTGCRGEIEMRIQQRDNFSVQFIVAIGAVLSLALSDFSHAVYLLFLMPAITVFYTMQILYSYSIHDRIHLYLVNVLEPEMREILGYSHEGLDAQPFWETYSYRQAKRRKLKAPGIRRGFYVKACCIMPAVSSILFVLFGIQKGVLASTHLIFAIGAAFMLAYYAIVFWILRAFKKSEALEKSIHSIPASDAPSKATNLDALSEIDYIDPDFSRPEAPIKAVFIDRDGTLHKDKVMTHKVEDLEYFQDTVSSLKRLTELGYAIIIVTNQEGIARGIYTREAMSTLHEKIINDLLEYGIKITAIYYSPYMPSEEHISYKPEPGMLMRAKYELNLDMEASFFIGDQLSDVKAANRMRVTPIMVTTGIYAGGDYATEEYKLLSPKTFASLTDATEFIKSELHK